MHFQRPLKRPHNKTRLLLFAGLLLSLVTLAYIGYAYNTSHWPFIKESFLSNPEIALDSTDYKSPTQEDINASQDAKKNADNEKVHENHTKVKKSVPVGVTFADVYNENVEIRAFTPAVIESDGVCSVKLTNGSHTVNASSSGFIDAKSTQCKPIYLPLSKFPVKGTWILHVSYTSPVSEGTTEPIEVTL